MKNDNIAFKNVYINDLCDSLKKNPESAKLLADNGFTKVHLLTGGLWSIRARAANQKGLTRLMKWVIDVPADNL